MKVLEPEIVRSELEKILTSPLVTRSGQRAALLRYLVERALAGSNGSIKESVIGVEVFGRAPDWDPQSDSTVRMHVGRLREKLREYYITEGQDDPVFIEIPKGAYTPRSVIPCTGRQGPNQSPQATTAHQSPNLPVQRNPDLGAVLRHL